MRRRHFHILLIFLTTLSLLLLASSLIVWPLSHTRPRTILWEHFSGYNPVPANETFDAAYLLPGNLQLRHDRTTPLPVWGPMDIESFDDSYFNHILGIKIEYIASHDRNQSHKLFSIDLPFYLLVLFAVIPSAFGMFLLSRKRRLKSGLCRTCRYDLRAHAPGQKCPECGTLIETAPAIVSPNK